MVAQETIVDKSVSYSGIVDMKSLYETLWNTITLLGYGIEEKEYNYKEKQDGKEIVIIWEASKKYDEYVKALIKLTILGMGIKPVQVQTGTRVEEKESGKIKISIKGVLLRDYNDTWEKNAILKLFQGFYEKYLYIGTYKSWKAKIAGEVDRIISEIKAYFSLQQM